jgi:glyoxylase-like metal-dependent hydrolase (beta-lactamase superfamily II)
VFITHAHPDHFNGALELVRDREVRVHATSGVVKVIREIADAKRAQWRPVYGAEWPTETYYPNTELDDGQPVSIDGLTITARELGPGESHADSILLVQPAGGAGAPLAFTGDLAFGHAHPYTADGHTGAWLATLDRLAEDLEVAGARRLLPGHGAPTGLGLLAEQRRYLLCYREVVRRLADGAAKLSDPAKVELEAMMRRFLPDAPLTWMIGLGADAVADELAAEADRPSPERES